MTDEQNSGSELYVLWHARHLAIEEDGQIIHRDSDGSIHLNEEEWRIVGFYSNRAAAEKQREESRRLPGFRDECDCFDISTLVLDEDLGTDGFFTENADGSQQD